MKKNSHVRGFNDCHYYLDIEDIRKILANVQYALNNTAKANEILPMPYGKIQDNKKYFTTLKNIENDLINVIKNHNDDTWYEYDYNE